MSVGHGGFPPKADERLRLHLVAPHRWTVWSVPRAVLGYVLLVDVVAITVIVATATAVPVQRHHLVWFAVLTAGSLAHFEVTRRIERIRELASEGPKPYVNLHAIWTFAGLILLPPPLVAILVVVSYAHLWFRVTHRILLYRAVFNTAVALLATAAGGAVLAVLTPGSYPGLPHGWVGIAVVTLAAAARFLVNSLLVLGAIVLSAPGTSVRRVLGNTGDYVVEAASLSLGAATAALLVLDPPLVLVLLVPVLVVHRALLVSQLQAVARKDGKTGLLNATFWHELAGKEVERARRLGSTVGVLMVDLDHFKAVNDRYGHLAGDQVLRQIATLLSSEVREYDLVGRFGGEEFVLLLPAISPDELGQVAERVRLGVLRLRVEVSGSDQVVDRLSVSIGGALYPTTAGNLEELLRVADTGLFTAKDAGRNRVHIEAPPPAPAALPEPEPEPAPVRRTVTPRFGLRALHRRS